MELNYTANIKRIAKEKGLQLKDLAITLDITRETLSRLINNENPTIATVEKIAKALNVEPSEILFGIKDDPQHQEQQNNICPHCGKKIKITLQPE